MQRVLILFSNVLAESSLTYGGDCTYTERRVIVPETKTGGGLGWRQATPVMHDSHVRTRTTGRDPSSLIERDRNRCRPICLNFGGEATERRFRAAFCARLSSLVSTTGQEERYQRFTVVTRPPFIATGHRRPGEIATSRLRFRCRSTLIFSGERDSRKRYNDRPRLPS